MGASAAAPTPLPRDKSVIATLHYLFWYDMDYPHSQYSGYQDMLPESIYGIPYKIGTKSIPSIRFLNTVCGCTKYIVIITGRKKKTFVSEIHNSSAVIKIYIIKSFAEKVQKWANIYPKVQVYRDYVSLIEELKAFLHPLEMVREPPICMKTAIEYLAHPHAITMKQRTVSALEDEKAQQDDQLIYRTVYSLALQSLINIAVQAKHKENNPLTFYLQQYGLQRNIKLAQKDNDLFISISKLSIRLDQSPLVFSGLSIPEVRSIIKKPALDMDCLINCFLSVDPNIPLKDFEPRMVKSLHQILCQTIAFILTSEYGDNWQSLYFPAMQLADFDFCFKKFLQHLVKWASMMPDTTGITPELSATLDQAAIASDIRISAFSDVLQRAKNASPKEQKEWLSEKEGKIAEKYCAIPNILLFDFNTTRYNNILEPLKKKCESLNKNYFTYKILKDFDLDLETLSSLRNKTVFAVIHDDMLRLDYYRMLDIFVRESISPIMIIYIPDAQDKEISKSMFKHKWIITTVYCETMEDILSYVTDNEINLRKEMGLYSQVYADFEKTKASIRGASKKGCLSQLDDVEYDAGFEILTDINKEIFNQLVEELNLGTKLIGSLHYYMWNLYKEQHREDVYWENYAPLFGFSPKTMNILDINFGKNILKAYTLQTNPPFYKMLNDAFRGGNPEKISKYRGFYVILHDLIKKQILTTYTGHVFRGTYFNPKVLSQLKPGQRVFSTCFTSTSKNEYVARGFARKTHRNVLLEIALNPAAHSNVDIHREGVSVVPEEEEVLVLPFTAFEIRSFSYEENLTLIHLQEVVPEVNLVALKGIDYYN